MPILFMTASTWLVFAMASFSNFQLGESSPPCSYSCKTDPASSYSFGENGLSLLTAFEGFSSSCYLDSEGIYTIGYGHACLGPSSNLPEYGVTCSSPETCSGSLTEAEGRAVLASDVAFFVECIQRSVSTAVTQNQFDALVSFSFNVGCTAFKSSTLLSKLNAGTLTDKEAQYQLTRWHSGCTAGLERRRFTESLLFSTCASSFACDKSSCEISYKFEECSSGCQYCSKCGGCSGESSSLPECSGGAGNGCSDDVSYIVVSVDTLSAIASRFDVEGGSGAIFEANGDVLESPDDLQVGMDIVIPGGGEGCEGGDLGGYDVYGGTFPLRFPAFLLGWASVLLSYLSLH